MKIWWLSFSGEKGSLGVCIVEAETKQDAVDKAKTLKEFPSEKIDDIVALSVGRIPQVMEEVKELGMNRFISASELMERDYHKIRINSSMIEAIMEAKQRKP